MLSDLKKLQDAKIKNINLVFENVEELVIPIRYIKHFFLSNINPNYSYGNENQVIYDSCDSLTMMIDKSFNISINNGLYGEYNAFDRITQYNDIVAIEVQYEDENIEPTLVYVSWCEIDSLNNLNQISVITKDGDLLLCISDDCNIDKKISIAENAEDDEDDDNYDAEQ